MENAFSSESYHQNQEAEFAPENYPFLNTYQPLDEEWRTKGDEVYQRARLLLSENNGAHNEVRWLSAMSDIRFRELKNQFKDLEIPEDVDNPFLERLILLYAESEADYEKSYRLTDYLPNKHSQFKILESIGRMQLAYGDDVSPTAEYMIAMSDEDHHGYQSPEKVAHAASLLAQQGDIHRAEKIIDHLLRLVESKEASERIDHASEEIDRALVYIAEAQALAGDSEALNTLERMLDGRARVYAIEHIEEVLAKTHALRDSQSGAD